MWEVVALTSTCLLPFSYIVGNRMGYTNGYYKGYKTGSYNVLNEWKKFNDEVGYDDK